MNNCDCAKASLEKGYIVRDSTYDEVKHDFITLDTYYMPLIVKNSRGKDMKVNLQIKCCPICGKPLAEKGGNNV